MTTKKDLVNNISSKISYISKEDITESVDYILEYLSGSLSKNHAIEIRGFGSLSIRSRKYAGSDKKYNTIYYRMAKSVIDDLNKK